MSIKQIQRNDGLLDSVFVEEFFSDGYAQAVVATDKTGRIVFCRGSESEWMFAGEQLDTLLAGMLHSGNALRLGELNFSMVSYSSGILVLGATASHNLILLAKPGANLGQLLVQARRMCDAVREN